MNLTLSKNHNPNYLAKIVKIDSFKPHPNADRMKLAQVDGFVVSVGIDTEPGIFIYFPIECQIHNDYVSKNNLYRHKELNVDQEKFGYIEDNRRVRCIKLRDFASEGMLMPIDSLSPLVTLPNNLEQYVGIEFDMLEKEQLVKKYVPKHIRTPGTPGSRSRNKEKKYEEKIVENQFRFHVDTEQFKKNLFRFNPDTIIHISDKWHGTSHIACNLLVNKKLSWYEKILKKIGVNIVDKEYQIFCASRKVIKDPEINKTLSSGFYDVDIWNVALEVLKPYLTKGITIYSEIVGYLPNGKMIQKDYDYKCQYIPGVYNYSEMTPQQMYDAKLFKIMVYRITYTNVDGKVFEMSARNLQQYCEKYGLTPVKELFYGYVAEFLGKGIFNEYTLSEEEVREQLLKCLQDTYLEKQCKECNTKVPAEGVVVRVDQPNFEAYKLKSLAFLQKESKELDAGTEDIESQDDEE